MADRADHPLELNLPHVVDEVRRAFEKYEADLVANRVEQLVAWFWDDPRAVRYGIDESLYGFEEIAAYRRSQADRTVVDRLMTVETVLGLRRHPYRVLWR